MFAWCSQALRRGIEGLVSGWRHHRPAVSYPSRSGRPAEALAGLDERLLADLGVTRAGRIVPDGALPPHRPSLPKRGMPVIIAGSKTGAGMVSRVPMTRIMANRAVR